MSRLPAGERLPPTTPAEVLERTLVVIQNDYIALLEDPKFIAAKKLSEELRTRAIEIYRQEIIALKELDPSNVTVEEIQIIRADYDSRVEQLLLKPD